MIVYFCQHGRFAGYWKRVPLQTRVPNLRSRLTARAILAKETAP